MASACDGMEIFIKNVNVYDKTGKLAPISIVAAGAARKWPNGTPITLRAGEKNGGQLSPGGTLPITVAPNSSHTLRSESGSGSGGWVIGTVTIQFLFAPTQPQTITVAYSGEPGIISHTSSCKNLFYVSEPGVTPPPNLLVVGSASPKGNKNQGCSVTFTFTSTSS